MWRVAGSVMASRRNVEAASKMAKSSKIIVVAMKNHGNRRIKRRK
jgi:hypothetical protein